MHVFKVLTIIAIFLLGAATAVFLFQPTTQQWDCTDDLCVPVELEQVVTCKGEEGVYVEHCRKVNETGNVSIMTDQENFVTTKITRERYDIEEIPVNHRIRDMIIRDDTLYYTTVTGELILHDLTTNEETTIFLDEELADGLLGLALDQERIILYLYATDIRNVSLDTSNETVDALYNRVSSFVIEDDELTDEIILLDDIPGNGGHVAGKLFIDDKYLYVTTGDSEYQKTNNTILHEKIQETNNLVGKTLRIYLNGSVPQDNPYNNEVYTYGHRNPLGIDKNPQTGSLFISEHGPWRHDEINKLTKGANYGWPGYRCGQEYFNVTANNTKPEYCFDEFTLAPGQLAFIQDENHEWYTSAFVTGLRSKLVYRLIFDDDQVIDSEVFYFRNEPYNISPRLRAITYHNNSLYVAGDQHGLIKLTP